MKQIIALAASSMLAAAVGSGAGVVATSAATAPAASSSQIGSKTAPIATCERLTQQAAASSSPSAFALIERLSDRLGCDPYPLVEILLNKR